MNAYEIVSRAVRSCISLPLEGSDYPMLDVKNDMYIKVALKDGKLEIPLILKECAKSCSALHNALYLPIHINAMTWPVKSVQSLAGNMKAATQAVKRVDFKGTIYYVGAGFMLRDDFSPMMSFNIITKKGSRRFFDISGNAYTIVLKVNANVFSFEDPVSKFIRNQLIPKTTLIRDIVLYDISGAVPNIDIMICHDCNDILHIVRPEVPNNEYGILGINDFLQRNINMLCNEEQ